MGVIKDIRSMKTPLTLHLSPPAPRGLTPKAAPSPSRALRPSTSAHSLLVPESGHILVLGADAAAKAQFCADLARWIGGRVLATPRLVRAACASSHRDATRIAELLTAGKLLPAELLVELLAEEVQRERTPCVLADFPTTPRQAALLDAALGAPRLVLELCVDADGLPPDGMPAAAEAAERLGLGGVAHTVRVGTRAVTSAAALLDGGRRAAPAPPPRAAKAVVPLLGGAAGGLGGFGEALAARLGGAVLRPSELLRAACAEGGEAGARLTRLLTAGKLVPPELLVQIVAAAVAEAEAPVFLEGFPSTPRQYQLFHEVVGPLRQAVAVQQGDDAAAATQRLLHRLGGETFEGLTFVVNDGPHALDEAEAFLRDLLGY